MIKKLMRVHKEPMLTIGAPAVWPHPMSDRSAVQGYAQRSRCSGPIDPLDASPTSTGT